MKQDAGFLHGVGGSVFYIASQFLLRYAALMLSLRESRMRVQRNLHSVLFGGHN